ncbi:MAG TPA: hypothetical protein VK550_12310 [Polyangiaceae bacterium]|nr:hypothetical protein [Polyangiaceae bacterium]
MSLVPLGSLSLAAAVPGAATANAALDVAIGIAAPNVSAQLTAAASFSPSVSLGLADLIAIAEAILANIEAALAAIPPIPVLSLDAQVDLALAIKVDLDAMLLTVQAQLTIQLQIASLLATGGVVAYAWDGANNALGPALTAELGGGSTHSNAIILYTTSGVTWTAMSSLFKTTP